MPLEITQQNIQEVIEQSTLPVIVDVYAVWCGPCQQMAPIFEELAVELAGSYKFASINVDDQRELSIKYGVSSVPTFLFIKNNEVKGREIGYLSKDKLLAKIKEYLS